VVDLRDMFRIVKSVERSLCLWRRAVRTQKSVEIQEVTFALIRSPHGISSPENDDVPVSERWN